MEFISLRMIVLKLKEEREERGDGGENAWLKYHMLMQYEL